ncbi:transposase [Massilia forsythiae]|uniref:transposase n=1 Tax=Massilia forsythiae TaxID=2728020 RepID=UPI001E401BE2|nr:transposase [Massilia forsythiae]
MTDDTMARRPRLLLPAVPLHIIQRGNNRNPCFAEEADYLVYLSLLQQYAAAAACQIHAYVLMTNHVHLLLSSGSANGPSVLMRRLGQHYVQYFNRRYQRTGTLWEGRFRSSLVDHERYLLVCQRYIELNPVRARMVSEPGQYRWSSFRANALGEDDPLITPHIVYEGLGRHDAERRCTYRCLFEETLSDHMLEQIRYAGNSNSPLGPESFVVETSRSLGMAPRRKYNRQPVVVGKNLPDKVL